MDPPMPPLLALTEPWELEPDRRRVRDLRLTIDVTFHFSTSETRRVRVLIDTGSEVNLIRRGIIPPHLLTPVKRPLRIATASHELMPGGDKEVACKIVLTGIEHDTRAPRAVKVPTTLYEADIGVEAILSYEWLTTYNFLVNPGLHALMKKIPGTGDIITFPGNHVHRAEVASTRRVETPETTKTQLSRPQKRVLRTQSVPRPPRVKNVLDLFSCTGSVGATFAAMGYRVFSVDIDPRYKPTITVDITAWQYWKCFPPLYFEIIACCPPCTEFSHSMTTRPRDYPKADKMVKTALEIVEYYQPAFWFL